MNNDAIELDALRSRAKALREEREVREAALADCRRQSRDLAIQLFFDHGYTINKISALTGHMRPTLKVWIDVELSKRPAFKASVEQHD